VKTFKIILWTMGAVGVLAFSAYLFRAPPPEAGLLEGAQPWAFKGGLAAWEAQDCQISSSDVMSRSGRPSLHIRAEFPGQASIIRAASLLGAGYVAGDVYLPRGAPETIKAVFFAKNKDGLWYQRVLPQPLVPARWNRIVIDTSPESIEMQPVGHFGRWNADTASQMSAVGLKFLCDETARASLFLNHLQRYKGAAPPPPKVEPLAMVNLQTATNTVERYGKFEITFQLNREFDNPFDPEEVRVDAVFRRPDGVAFSVPGFFYQGFIRTQLDGQEKLIRSGQGCWKIRFTPKTAGTYSYWIHAVAQNGRSWRDRVETTTPRQLVVTPSSRRGFVRISPTDWRYFEFETGEYFYPIGHNIRSPTDARSAQKIYGQPEPPPDRGTFAYDDYFRKMRAHGENFVEVWMASWWLGLEWTARWKHFRGLELYNLQSAWKLDYLVEAAEKSGLYVHLVFDNHGKLSQWCDPEWAGNPYSIRNGGFLRHPEEFFTSRRARALYQQKLRYIVARWGYSPFIFGYELWSELDLTGNRQNFRWHSSKSSWHREVGQYLRGIDRGNHLITTHYSQDYTHIDRALVRLPQIDYIVVDGYRMKRHQDIVSLLRATYRFPVANGSRKPIFVTEYGGSPYATTKPGLLADLHCGLWYSFVSPAGASPLFWWFDYIDRENLYFHFQALAHYVEGEDKRDPELLPASVKVTGVHGGPTPAVACLKSGERAYLWLYDRAILRQMPTDDRAQTIRGAAVTLHGMTHKRYRVEIWDTYTGKILSTTTLESDEGRVVVRLPDFKKDIAVKVKVPSGDL